jgi:hypothetical protein
VSGWGYSGSEFGLILAPAGAVQAEPRFLLVELDASAIHPDRPFFWGAS